MTQYRIGLLRSYWVRVLRRAVSEALRLWFFTFGAALGLAVLVVILGGALRGLLAFVLAWLVILVWFVLTIPAQIESDYLAKEQQLQTLSQRRNMANEIRNHMITCRMSAQQARDAEIAANAQDGRITPDPYHQQALKAAHDAEERLRGFGMQTGQHSYDAQILEITGAVKTRKCATAEEAIAQLEGLADVFERQLSSGLYW